MVIYNLQENRKLDNISIWHSPLSTPPSKTDCSIPIVLLNKLYIEDAEPAESSGDGSQALLGLGRLLSSTNTIFGSTGPSVSS